MIESLIVTYILISHFYWTNIDWIRIGAFFLESSAAIVTEKLICPPRRIPQKETLEQMLQSRGLCVLTNIKTGIWIAGIFNSF